MSFEEFVVINGSYHKAQCSNLKVQSLQGFVSFEKFVVSTNPKGYLAFHAPPYGGGVGGGASWGLLVYFVVLLFCIFPFYSKLSPNIAFLISFSCSNTKRATIALNRAVEGSFTLVADFRRSRTPLRSESM